MFQKLNHNQRVARLVGFAIVAAPLAATTASAAVPAAYTTALDELVTDAGSFVQSVYVKLAAVLLIAVLGALFFKGMKKGKAAI